AEARAAGVTAIAVRCDVADEGSVRAAIEAARERLGGLSVLVNNAANRDPSATVVELDLADWQRTLDINLTGAFLTAKHAIPLMAEGGGGSVINVASQLARVASPRSPAYCATKAALVQLSKVLALDHAAQGIRANSLSPGGIETDRLVYRFGSMEQAREQIAAKHILGRLGRPDEVAEGAVFLASDESSFMTGADLLIDGGYTATV
ncbi:MAG: SDR family oxidoreductase, partial [Chloroflexi bacterium]|nr:SDR family oxidoreductase [Chloroflexota bacterium]